jgi:AcrR family transcriptional regulator
LSKERKEQIIRAAAKRFARHGMGKTTLEEIARDIRIGKATIYHYFSSKEDLFYETINWEAAQFIEDIKAIFNNQEIPVGARLLEYFSYKESVYQKYKLLYELMLQLFKDDSFEKEKNILHSFLENEKQIVELILSSIYSERIESMDTSLPYYIVHSSWGLMFGSRLNQISENGKSVRIKELMFKSLENLLK